MQTKSDFFPRSLTSHRTPLTERLEKASFVCGAS